jgi:hypothetical protein
VVPAIPAGDFSELKFNAIKYMQTSVANLEETEALPVRLSSYDQLDLPEE